MASDDSWLRRGAGRAPCHPPLLSPGGAALADFLGGGGSALRPPPLSCCPALRGRARAPERGARTLHGAPPPLAEEMPNFPLPPRRRRARSRAGGGGAGARRSGHRGDPAAASAAPPPARDRLFPRRDVRDSAAALPGPRASPAPLQVSTPPAAVRPAPCLSFPVAEILGGVAGLRAPGRSILPAPEALRFARGMLYTSGPRFAFPEARGRPVSSTPFPAPRRPLAGPMLPGAEPRLGAAGGGSAPRLHAPPGHPHAELRWVGRSP